MRIVKLSEDIFPELEDVIVFFRDYLPERTPPGKFRITEGRIAQDGLEPGERFYINFNATTDQLLRDDLEQNWDRLRNDQTAQKIEPLE